MRYEPFIRLLDEVGAREVLDVGSGWYGLSWYWPHRVVQTDLDFSGERPLDPRPGDVAFVRSTAERLPFADDSFDYVLSSDMFEHLPLDVRAQSVVELTRVARRGVLVGFPTGPAARVDRFFARLLRLRGRDLPSWLEEHLQQTSYPDRETLSTALPDGWVIREQHPNGNAALSGLVGLAEMWGTTYPLDPATRAPGAPARVPPPGQRRTGRAVRLPPGAGPAVRGVRPCAFRVRSCAAPVMLLRRQRASAQ